jgi:hypothetical protein
MEDKRFEDRLKDIERPADNGLDTYQKFADTVGGVPSLRWQDNLYQGLAILAALALGAGIGFLITFDSLGAMAGGFLGLVAGFLISGMVLMVLGWLRASKAKKEHRH